MRIKQFKLSMVQKLKVEKLQSMKHAHDLNRQTEIINLDRITEAIVEDHTETQDKDKDGGDIKNDSTTSEESVYSMRQR